MHARGWGGCSTRSTPTRRCDGRAVSPRRRFPWDRLGIDETSDTGAIRKAYADALRAINVDEDIAGYADLRRARDEALWLAAHTMRVGEAEDEGDDLGSGDLDSDLGDDGEIGADWFDDDEDYDDLWDDRPPAYQPASASPSALALSEAQERAQAAWQKLTGILYPEGQVSEDAVTLGEMQAGLGALDVLITRSEEADLAEHDALDGALADLFARTWPRSAPFVEPANAAFQWLDEAGSIEERPALMFLNQRLKGMRFHEKVQQPGHPLHRAWVELSRPGAVGLIDRLRVKRVEVHKLIDGVRRNFPELESHLDPQRVASWDRGATSAGPDGSGPRIVRGIVIVLLVVAIPRLLSQCDSTSNDKAPPVVQLSDAAVDAKMAELFGPGTDMKAVEAKDLKLARELRLAVNMPEIIAPLNYLRLQALGSAEVADRAALEARAELKAIWLTAAQAKSVQFCRMAINGDLRVLPLDLSAKDRAREQVLLRKLLDAKVLSHVPKGGETRYSVPGWLVSETLKRSGLSEEKLKAALTDPDSTDRCKAETALVQAVVASPKKVPDDVLKGL